MKQFIHKIILAAFIIGLPIIGLPAFCGIVEGGVQKQELSNKIMDYDTNMPLGNARITLPQKHYQTFSDSKGQFSLNESITGPTVLSVEKDGYKPFSITINEKIAARPIVIGVEKSNSNDIIIETTMFHLGDNSFSSASANSGDFQVKSVGPFYTKNFRINSLGPNSSTYLIIGSIIGIDTYMAKTMGQNSIINSYASPPEVFFNGAKISEIQLNGDNQRIKLPNNLIRQNELNQVTIKTGKNLLQTAYIDYDDIEIMNIRVETK